ncbi:hypothetical protein V6N11_025535 [Hibiscus sabdariffa]|uniref:Uncharacterized protein n=1 Tax=Hibiscus sabdariffa TaxID=183260 RepID=A0ABR2NIY9_9ROSI
MKFGESSSESTSKKHVFQAPEVSAQMKGSVEEEALTAMCFGKEVNDENILEERKKATLQLGAEAIDVDRHGIVMVVESTSIGFEAKLVKFSPDRPLIINFGDSDLDTGRVLAGTGLPIGLPHGITVFHRGLIIDLFYVCSIKYTFFRKYIKEMVLRIHLWLVVAMGGPPYNYNKKGTYGQPGSTICNDASRLTVRDGVHYSEASNRAVSTTTLSSQYSTPQMKVMRFWNWKAWLILCLIMLRTNNWSQRQAVVL